MLRISRALLAEFELHVYGELLDHLSYKVDRTTIMANTHLAYPDLALDKFSGTDPGSSNS